MHIIRIVTLVLALAVFAPVTAYGANEVTVSDDTILVLPADGSQYTLSSGSKFDYLEILTSTFHFSMSGGSIITLTSADKKNFVSVPVISVTCSANQSSITLSFAAGAPTQPVDITPSSTCDAAAGPGGGSPSIGQSAPSGGGGSPPPAPPPPSPSPAPAPVPSSVQPPAPPPSGQQPPPPPIKLTPPVSPLIFKNLFPGNRGKEVRQLQLLLAQDKSVYPSGIANGVYGPATRNAVKKFQAKYGIAQTGNLGPATRTKLQQVFGGQAAAPATPPPTLETPTARTPGIQGSAEFSINLQRGNKGDDVTRLQQLLSTDTDIYPEASVNGVFGPATQRAVARFQEKHGITPNGRVGPLTRSKLQEVFGNQTRVLPIPQTPVATQTAPKSKSPQIDSLQEQIAKLQKMLLELKKK